MVWGDYEHYPNETNTILQGFTLQNARLDENGEDNSSSGGGTYGGTIIECRIRNNRATGGGGARFAYLYHCIVEGNYAGDDGGGILNCQAYDTLIANNYANNREGSKAGGGAGCSVLYNCTVTGNTSCYGYWWTDWDMYPCAAVDFVSEAYNCVIYGNKFQNGEVIYRGRRADVDEGTARGSQFYNCYVSDPGFVDAANGDYRLAAGSPCIDAGANSYVTSQTDLAGNDRIVNGTVDIGCYEYVSRVDPDSHGKVQLWEGGPYWATTNIGADEPWDYGYYFWWGDTVGYEREGGAWVASDGSSSYFSFGQANTPTYPKAPSVLQSEEWITTDNVLTPEHDAAQVHWGGAWRMPTVQELRELNNNCDWFWATTNGVNGYVVRGRGEYASASIFLPAAGYGDETSLSLAGSRGYYWSSVPGSDYYDAWYLLFGSSFHSTYGYDRYDGQSVRPVQGFTE